METKKSQGEKVNVDNIVSGFKWAICKKHGKIEQFEPDEFGLNYYQAVGECFCGRPTYYENGERTKITLVLKSR